MAHSPIDPGILYFSTPVALISTQNEDSSTNIEAISSSFWLGNRCMMGLQATSQTTINLLRTWRCVINFTSDDMTAAVSALARTTGTSIVPDDKIDRGYVYVKDEFGAAGLTPETSELVEASRIRDCPVRMEAEMMGRYDLFGGAVVVLETKVLRTYVMDDHAWSVIRTKSILTVGTR